MVNTADLKSAGAILAGSSPVLGTTGYCLEGDGEPPNASAYPSGFLVKDVLVGKAEWVPEAVDEFAEWLESDPRVNAYIEESFHRIDAAIQSSPVWDSSFGCDAAL